jgi:hypothetical protein
MYGSTSGSSSTGSTTGAGGTYAGAEASTTIVPAARSPNRWRRWPVASITISPTM